MEEEIEGQEDLTPDKEQFFKDEIVRLKKQLRESYREQNLAKEIREKAFNLSSMPLDPPLWLSGTPDNINGIPTLFISDWHWGEKISDTEVSFKNSFNIAIARERAELCFQRFSDVYTKHIKTTAYDGCVLAMGGDMVSGTIHDELTETNEVEIMPAVVDCAENIISGIKILLKSFNKVAAFGVVGNHGRTTVKSKFKKKVHTSYDWLIYAICEKYFINNQNVRFHVPESSDCIYTVCQTRYLLTHGDTLGRGGDGIIGMLGPVTRGDHRRRARQMGMNEAYDILLCGHWHQLAMLRSRIVNGSLKGFDEFAYGLGFPPEPPMQASWLTHPDYGVTIQVPIFCDIEKEQTLKLERGWVGWPESKHDR